MPRKVTRLRKKMTLSERLASDMLVTSAVLTNQDLARASALIGMTNAKIPTCDLDKVAAGLKHLVAQIERSRVQGRVEVMNEAKVRIAEIAEMNLPKKHLTAYLGDHAPVYVAPQAKAA
jgi:hypothetical protein